MNGQADLSTLRDLVTTSLDDDKAFDIEVINLSEQSHLSDSAIADYIVIASGTSTTQVKSLAKKLEERLNLNGVKNIRIEGIHQGDWVVLDMGDIVVHLFRPEVREFYNIEKMWNMPTMETAQDSILTA